ncbi:MAG TPA: flagellar basal-body MS-ring/collar protein FliF, partial [Myxococcales bacterium]|nr:flagellar basal-body MS-ring/collar protein FliF [Myxococcales bacterium]
YQYAFTNLTAEDSGEAAAALKVAGLPYRLEAGGAALAVPADKVYEARLLLASLGLPRGGGVPGNELFDHGDIGISEFTQKVNLRRALEGELARTISHLGPVRSARVHLTIGEKGLYRDDDKQASAAVVVNLQPGHVLDEKEIEGIRHLVSSAVTGLTLGQVSVMDGSGKVLAAEADKSANAEAKPMEKELETRIVALLEPVVGRGAVIAKVTATMDETEVRSQAETYDPDGAVLRSEHKSGQSSGSGPVGAQATTTAEGVAGAAANQATSTATSVGVRAGSNTQDESKNYELSRTTTSTVQRGTRLAHISVAILLDAPEGKPRTDAEVAKLGELAKRAIGFDATRGDAFQIDSATFQRAPVDGAQPAAPVAAVAANKTLLYGAGAAGLVVLGVVVAVFARRRKRPQPDAEMLAALRPGAHVAEIEATLAGNAQLVKQPARVDDPVIQLHARARELALQDPTRAAHLLRAWIHADTEKQGALNG